MVTVNSMLGEYSGTGEFEFKGLSTDSKPTGTFGGKTIGDNSLFLELDTGDNYYYSGGSWNKMGASTGTQITAEDNGKVVVNGELTAQTSRSITENGTYDTTANNSVTVNVPGLPSGVVILKGTGTTAVELPSGFAFPDAADCNAQDPSDPFVTIRLVYLETNGEDMMGDEFRTRISNEDYGSASGGRLVFGDGMNAQVEFGISNGAIAYDGGTYMMADTLTADASAEWMILIVDNRPAE